MNNEQVIQFNIKDINIKIDKKIQSYYYNQMNNLFKDELYNKLLNLTDIQYIVASFCSNKIFKDIVTNDSKFINLLKDLRDYKYYKDSTLHDFKFKTINDLLKFHTNSSNLDLSGYRAEVGKIRKILYVLTNGFIDLLTNNMRFNDCCIDLTHYENNKAFKLNAALYNHILSQKDILNTLSMKDLGELYSY